jgi:hypothetical protein
MCCFSKPVNLVANTNIFARASKDGRQFLVYSMTISAKEDLAMILPIATPKDAKEDAVKFINLEKYPEFFKDMLAGFPEPKPPRGGDKSNDKDDKPKDKLTVVEVGSYEASFVPQIKDFSRLDERFRLPTDVWDKLPQYKEFGFAVFKLKKGENSKVHPMAFEFPRAKPKQLFFPTVHIHDGKVHDKADFDHWLFAQKGDGDMSDMLKWEESPQPAGLFMKIDKAENLLVKDGHCYRLRMKGMLKNEDVLV